MKTNKVIGFTLFLAIITIAGCTNTPTGNIAKEETITIGAVFHLTGPASFWGNGELKATQLAVEEINNQGGINGARLKVKVEDTQSDFPTTATSLNRLIDGHKLDIIIGPTWFGQVAAPLATQKHVLIISPSTGVTTEPTPYFFNLWPAERHEIETMVQQFKEEKVKKIAVIYSLNDWSSSMYEHLEKQKGDITIVKTYAATPDEQDYRSIITELQTLDIDAAYGIFAFYPGQGAFSKQLEELGIDLTLYSTSGTENPELLKEYPNIEGTIYAYPEKGTREAAFNKKYEEKYGEPPSPASAYAYDAVNLVAEALKTGARTPEEVSEYLHNIKDYKGASNTITFEEDGRVAKKPFIIKTVEGGAFKEKT